MTHWDAPAFTVKARTRCPALPTISPHPTPTHIHTHNLSFFFFDKRMSNQRFPGWPSRSHGQNYDDGSYAASAASAAPRDAPTAPYYDQYAASNDAYDRRGPAPGTRVKQTREKLLHSPSESSGSRDHHFTVLSELTISSSFYYELFQSSIMILKTPLRGRDRT